MAAVALRQLVHGRCWSQLLYLFPQNGGILFFNRCQISTSQSCLVGYKLKSNISDCYSLLNIKEDCSVDELKEAYFQKAKLYHPDSKSETADPKKFNQVKEAYKTIKAKMNQEQNLVDADDDDDDELIFRPRQVQHRQFLDNEGFGYGNKAQRQRQFDQYRVHRAQDSVYDYKVKRVMPEGDNALVAKDQKKARKAKMSNSMDRLVEDMIQESMSRGEFDNLEGKGKPLDFKKENPYMDKITQKLNQILVNDDVQPDWIMKQKEIRSDLKNCRERLAVEKKKLSSIQSTKNTALMWNKHVETFRTSILDINAKIQDYNLIVPILTKQMMPYNFDREFKKVCDNPEQFLPHDFYQTSNTFSSHAFTSSFDSDQPASLKEMWLGFKEVFIKK